jgi:hypothetical protein
MPPARRVWSDDARGRTTQLQQTILGSRYTTGYADDRLDRRVTVTCPDEEQVTTAYRAHGLPRTLTGTSTYVANGPPTEPRP